MKLFISIPNTFSSSPMYDPELRDVFINFKSKRIRVRRTVTTRRKNKNKNRAKMGLNFDKGNYLSLHVIACHCMSYLPRFSTLILNIKRGSESEMNFSASFGETFFRRHFDYEINFMSVIWVAFV